MEYKVLYRKYRPQDFDSIVGQEYTTTLLKNAISDDKISHAYIFTGPRGTGKTSSAKIFARAINCENNKGGNPCNKCNHCKSFNENPDIVEIDAASNNGIDDIRELIENSRLTPSMSKYKVYIIDEFHMLSTSAFNALLLTLEEPPKNVVFILATTDIQSVPITILSRCQRFDFKPISSEKIVDRLKYVCSEEKIDITDEALQEISYMSNGGLRDALSILDQISSKDGKIEIDDIVLNFGSISSKKVRNIIELFASGDVKKLIDTLNLFKNNGVDYRILANKIIEAFKNELIKMSLFECDYELNFENVYNLIIELNNSISNQKNSIDPYIFIELVLLKYINVSRETFNNNKDIPKEIKAEENVVNNLENTEDNIIENKVKSDEVKLNIQPNVEVDTQIVNIRINNCFVNAKKEYLNRIKEKWNDFLTYEVNANKRIMSYIADTDIVVASDKYALLTNRLTSAAELINKNIKSLEQDFKIFYGSYYRFICLSIDEWEKVKEKYIFNIKNNIKYSIIDEEEIQTSIDNVEPDDNSNKELEKLAEEIFDNEVEIR